MIRILLALLLLPIATGCSLGARGQSVVQTPPAQSPGATVAVTAEENSFEPTHLQVPGDVPFAVQFLNNDGVPHNVNIVGNGMARTGDVFTGPALTTYYFAALPAGTYIFQCDVHPQMRGEFMVGSSATD
jgi:plastocyanin